MAHVPNRGGYLDSSRTIWPSKIIKELFGRKQPRGKEAMTSDEVITYLKEGVVVTFFNCLHLAHVPMSLRARTSASDEWLRFIKSVKCIKVLDLGCWMIWLGVPSERVYWWCCGSGFLLVHCVQVTYWFLTPCLQPRAVCVRTLSRIPDTFWINGGTCIWQPPSSCGKSLCTLQVCVFTIHWLLRTVT